MAKGVHRIGNKGKFFQLKVKPSHSPCPRAFFLTYPRPIFFPPCPSLLLHEYYQGTLLKY